MTNIETNDAMKALVAEAVLKMVFDPEIGINVIDLGLIYGLDFDEAQQKVTLRMTLTTQFCPMGESIVGDATKALENAFPGYAIATELTFDPPWSYDRISKEGKEFLTT